MERSYQIITERPCTVFAIFLLLKGETNEEALLKNEKEMDQGTKLVNYVWKEIWLYYHNYAP